MVQEKLFSQIQRLVEYLLWGKKTEHHRISRRMALFETEYEKFMTKLLLKITEVLEVGN